MKSTSSSDVLVRAENLHLQFVLKLHADASLRGQFVSYLRNPLHAIANSARSRYLHVLNGINFQANRGDRIALIGKNGEGKSTLCRCLAGIYLPTSGALTVSGTVRSILDPGAIIYPELTGRENASILAALLYPELGSDIEACLEEALDFSGLGTFLDTPYRHYSNGMQTRLCLSIATCSAADIFILDEVFDGADVEFRERISRRILNLIDRSGVVFFVSHSESQVRRVCNKAILLDRGKIRATGSLDEVYGKYAELIGQNRASQ